MLGGQVDKIKSCGSRWNVCADEIKLTMAILIGD